MSSVIPLRSTKVPSSATATGRSVPTGPIRNSLIGLPRRLRVPCEETLGAHLPEDIVPARTGDPHVRAGAAVTRNGPASEVVSWRGRCRCGR
ncbi:hypothetical protein Jiend_54270 [Micromonospora endophytica]|nr:hypothetical protein Jiend_54270 [Micromonospora endophytica]